MRLRNLSALGTLAIALASLLGAEAASAVGIMRITEWMYNGDEFIEFTNVGDASLDLTGWSFSDNSSRTAGVVSLSAFGTVAAGQSVILSESDATAFRNSWGLSASVSVIGLNTVNLGRSDEINLFDGSTLVDRLTYNDQTIGGPRTQNVSGNILAANLGANAANLAVLSFVGDTFGSVASITAYPGNPGSHPAVVPEPDAIALLAFGAVALFTVTRRRRHSA